MSHETLEPVEGDLLPAIGEPVLFYLNSQDAWVEHEVVGYYVRPSMRDNVYVVNVRGRHKDGGLNMRALQDVIRRTRPAGQR